MSQSNMIVTMSHERGLMIITHIQITRLNRRYYIWKAKRYIDHVDTYITVYTEVVNHYIATKDSCQEAHEAYEDAIYQINDAYVKRAKYESFLYNLRVDAVDSIEVDGLIQQLKGWYTERKRLFAKHWDIQDRRCN